MTSLLLPVGNLLTVAEFLHSVEVPNLLDEALDLCVVACGGIYPLHVGQLADPSDQILPVST